MNVNTSHYTYRVSWSPDDQEYVGTCVEMPSLSWLDPSKQEALAGIEKLVETSVSDMEDAGEHVPEPIVDRDYSGRFNLRISPDLHRDLTLLAAEKHMSLNRYLSDRLARC